MSLTMAPTVDRAELFIGGAWQQPASNRRIIVRSATTEEVIGSVPEATEADVDRAVAAARRAFNDPNGWSQWEPSARATIIEKLADEVDARSEDTVRAIAQQNGMPITIARALEASYPSATLRFYANLIRKQPVEEERAGLFLKSTTIRRTPLGVVAGIVPWNVPQSLTMTKLAPPSPPATRSSLNPHPKLCSTRSSSRMPSWPQEFPRESSVFSPAAANSERTSCRTRTSTKSRSPDPPSAAVRLPRRVPSCCAP